MREQEIRIFEEITKPDVKYFFVDEKGNRTGKWVEVENKNFDDDSEFVINYKCYRHQLFSFVTKGNYVRTWKTFNGAVKFIKREFSIRNFVE